jgi:dsRNA-specific ribonuclease
MPYASLAYLQAVEEKLAEKDHDEGHREMKAIQYLVSTGTGNLCMEHPKAIADLVESCIGAVFVDTDGDYLAAFHVRNQPVCLCTVLHDAHKHATASDFALPH